MARATRELIRVLRKTVLRLRSGAHYQWGHLGSCNCGHLAQTVTHLSKADIHSAALQRVGDWGDVSLEYCETSGTPIDVIIKQMLVIGLSLDDIERLEDLSDPHILQRIPFEQRHLRRNQRDDVVRYMAEWADLLEEELIRAEESLESAPSGTSSKSPADSDQAA